MKTEANVIRRRRLELGWSQSTLGKKTGLSRQRISEYERGISLPDRARANLLSRALDLHVLLDQGHILKSGGSGLLAVRRYEIARPKREVWRRALSRWRREIARYRINPKATKWLEQYAPCDSTDEAGTYFQLIVAGASCRLANPHAWGYREQTIVDDTEQALGERRLPCFHWRINDELECVLWPQVNLRPGDTTFRADFLVLVRYGSRIRWCIIEIDGKGHDSSKDDYRDQQIGKPAWRINYKTVADWRVANELPQRLTEFLAA